MERVYRSGPCEISAGMYKSGVFRRISAPGSKLSCAARVGGGPFRGVRQTPPASARNPVGLPRLVKMPSEVVNGPCPSKRLRFNSALRWSRNGPPRWSDPRARAASTAGWRDELRRTIPVGGRGGALELTRTQRSSRESTVLMLGLHHDARSLVTRRLATEPSWRFKRLFAGYQPIQLEGTGSDPPQSIPAASREQTPETRRVARPLCAGWTLRPATDCRACGPSLRYAISQQSLTAHGLSRRMTKCQCARSRRKADHCYFMCGADPTRALRPPCAWWSSFGLRFPTVVARYARQVWP